MIKRTIEISTEPAHLAVKLDQLLIQRLDDRSEILGTVPCEDVGLLLVDQPATTYSHHALVTLVARGAVVVLCGRDHLPAGILLPLADHSQVVWRIHEQIAVSKPLQKQLWKQLVVAKVRRQAGNLEPGSAPRRRIAELARSVRSGDPTNVEAQAARVYWSAWMKPSAAFRRDQDGTDSLNAMLNYGYAVLRAAIARALVAGGSLPALGLHHSNRSNAFCLADDLLEPLRPMVDARVRALYLNGRRELDRSTKEGLLELLTATVEVGPFTGPMMVSLHRMVASLVRCYQGEEKRLLLPAPVREGGDDDGGDPEP